MSSCTDLYNQFIASVNKEDVFLLTGDFNPNASFHCELNGKKGKTDLYDYSRLRIKLGEKFNREHFYQGYNSFYAYYRK